MNSVSAVLTCYNEEEYIGDAIGSVVQQTRYDAISEIIVVDDGSEDNSEEVIREWGDRCSKLHYVHQENRGLPVARNTGIERSSGDFIALQDGDDIWLEERLEHQLCFLSDHPDVGLLYTDAYSFGEGEDGKKRGYCNRYEYGDSDVLRRLFVEGGSILPSTTLINNECFRTVGLFDPSLRLGQDTDLWLRIASRYSIQHIQKPLVLKRQRDQSLGSNVEEKARYLLRVTDKIADLYPELDPLRRKRKAKVYSGLARNRAVSGERKGAVQSAFQAIRYDPYTLKHYATLAFGLLPLAAPQLRRLRKCVQETKLRIRKILSKLRKTR
jgi:glycosyltransferase involved in cell wall biosynthesis